MAGGLRQVSVETHEIWHAHSEQEALGSHKTRINNLTSISMNLWASLLGCCLEREVPGGLPHTDWVYNLVQGYSAALPATGSWL